MIILHTSDWHVDGHAAGLGACAEAVREARWRALRRIPDLVRERSVDLVLVAGDLFDGVDAGDETVAEVVALLEDLAPARVLVLPGNHDPLVPGGVWERSAWRDLGDHVTLALAAEPVELDGEVVVYPCPLSQKASRIDPTEWIPGRREGDRRLRIGLAHGSLDAMAKAENFPISQERAAVAGLDYLALGDWHGERIFGGGRTAYPGTPEATSFGEQRTGRVLLVELDPDRVRAPAIESVQVGALSFLTREVRIQDATDVADLEAELLALGPPERALVRLRLRLLQDGGDDAGARQTTLLSGSLPEDANRSLVGLVESFRSKWSERLLFLDWQLEELEVGSGDLPAGLESLDDTLRRLLAGDEVDPAIADLVAEDPAVLREARWQLRVLAAEQSP